MISALSRFIDKLLREKSLPATKASRTIQNALQPMVDAGIIDLQKSGRGARYILNDAATLNSYIQQHYPGGLKSVTGRHRKIRENMPSSASDVKRSLAQGAATATMRFFSGQLTYPDIVVDANKMTRQLGVVSAQIYSDTLLRMECNKVAIVGNLELFYYVEHIHEELDCALYADRWLHNALLDWLCNHDKDIEFIYFGSYSPAGAQEYIRLRDRLNANVSFYIPDNLEELFCKHTDQALLRNHIADYRKIRSENDPAVKRLVALMAQHGGGVEQEVLLMGDG